MRRKIMMFGAASLLFLAGGQAVYAAIPGIDPWLKFFDASGKETASFLPLAKDFNSTVSLASGDVNHDGRDEIVIGFGAGYSPIVKIYNLEGQVVGEFLAYSESFKGGVNVAVGDYDGDGQAEIITAPGFGGGPHVRVFKDGQPIYQEFVFAQKERSGAQVASGDIDKDGKAEIIFSSGLNSNPEVGYLKEGKFFKKGLPIKPIGGVNVSSGDINNDDRAEIIVSYGYGNKPEVLVMDSNFNILKSFFAYDEGYIGGVNTAVGDINNDDKAEIITVPSFGAEARIGIFSGEGERLKQFLAYEFEYKGGGKIASIKDADGSVKIITLPERIFESLNEKDYKYISVDLKSQTLTYWQNGYQLGKFLISSGLRTHPTPKGEFSIFLKRASVRMSGYYGYNHPDNYDLPGVPWVSSFKGPYTIHGTYWHNNFGHQMSHGCVNMKTPEAKIIYDWVDIGTRVYVK